MISHALVFVTPQGLIRKLCLHRRQAYKPSPKAFEGMKLEDKVNEEVVFHTAKGYSVCKNTGYGGRMAAMQALEINDDIRALILRKASEAEIRKAALVKGMIPFRENRLAKLIRGKTIIEELATLAGTKVPVTTKIVEIEGVSRKR